MAASPSANRDGSPRKRLTRLATTSAASFGIDHRQRADQRGNDAAAFDIANQHHRRTNGAGETEIGQIIVPQIDFRSAAGAFDQNQIALRRQFGKGIENIGQEALAGGEIVAGAHRADTPSAQHDLRPAFRFRFQKDRVHRRHRIASCGPGLQRLGAADLATIDGDRRVVGHVLRLEWRNLEPAFPIGAAEPGNDQRLTGIRAGAHEHQRFRARGFKAHGSASCVSMTWA